MSRKSLVKRSRPQASEQASDWIFANYYVTIGLTHNQRALLKETAARWGYKDQPCASAARMLVQLGLANLPLLEKRGKVLNNHCRANDLYLTTYLDELAAQTLRELAGPEQREMSSKKTANDAVPVSFRLPAVMYRRLLEKAASEDLNFSQLVKRAVRRETLAAA